MTTDQTTQSEPTGVSPIEKYELLHSLAHDDFDDYWLSEEEREYLITLIEKDING